MTLARILPFGRCRGRGYATQMGAARMAVRVGTGWFRCHRCGRWHVGRRPILTRGRAA